MIDRFGKDVSMIRLDDKRFVVNVEVAVSRQFLAWIIGLGEGVTEKKADSIQSVDIRKNVPARMNPREMKENNAADHSHSDRPQRIKRRN
jgi:hypothetical protein